MSVFWILTAALALLAVLFIGLPAFKFRAASKPLTSTEDERLRQNVAIFKERLSELESDLSDQKIDQQQFDDLKEELELALLTDAEKSESESTGSPSAKPLGISLVTAAMVIAASYVLYFETGSYDKVQQAQSVQFNEEEKRAAQDAAMRGDMSSLLQQLYDKLQKTPDNVEGWMLLSRTAMNMERFDMATEGYQKVIDLFEESGQSPAPIYGLLAQALYFDEGGIDSSGKMSAKVLGALDKALKIDPDETNALGLYAIHAFDTKDYPSAISYWEKVIAIVPDHPARESIEAGIQRARGLAGLAEAPVAEPMTSTEAQAQAQVTVTVALDDSVRDQVGPNDLVFIFARAESGPPMPLAASRHKVSELPVTVVLNDAKAMAPMAKLSQVQTANIVARVSKSGQPIAQAGDIQGRLDGVSVWEEKEVSIKIDTRL